MDFLLVLLGEFPGLADCCYPLPFVEGLHPKVSLKFCYLLCFGPALRSALQVLPEVRVHLLEELLLLLLAHEHQRR